MPEALEAAQDLICLTALSSLQRREKSLVTVLPLIPSRDKPAMMARHSWHSPPRWRSHTGPPILGTVCWHHGAPLLHGLPPQRRNSTVLIGQGAEGPGPGVTASPIWCRGQPRGNPQCSGLFGCPRLTIRARDRARDRGTGTISGSDIPAFATEPTGQFSDDFPSGTQNAQPPEGIRTHYSETSGQRRSGSTGSTNGAFSNPSTYGRFLVSE
ncbi:hypothetical protein UY3_06422 [Chelonia mydas]|uniref:Uncharacterized protein n=1 Tax=Chelonia mydas TaxID=8469 RepID=M7BL39_CHEMY|nr:hypothetical protein UY3_06422 [Chelonia mydas]